MVEKYSYELGDIPMTELETRVKRSLKGKQVRSDEEIIGVVREMLERKGLGKVDIRVAVSRYQGDDKMAKYADATVWESGDGGSFKIHIHPLHRYTPIGYLRDAVKHEIETHIAGKVRKAELGKPILVKRRQKAKRKVVTKKSNTPATISLKGIR